MRTLKKSLALVLALVMVLGLGVVGASADNKLDSYTDAGEIGDAYVEAVGVLTGLGIVDGRTDTEIVPEATYNRAEAAKIIAYMLLGKDQADALKATVAPFEDVSVDFWAAGYIAYCAELGIISGMTETTFEPYGTLTGYQWAKMLLVAVGYGKNGEFEGDSWSLNTATVVAKTDLNEGDLAAADHVALRREQAMLFAFNALNLKQVTYSPNSTNYVYDIWGYVFADGTGTTLGEEVYNLASVEGQIIDNEGMGNANTIVDPVNKWAKDVTIDANTDYDLMWHAVRVWYVDGKTNTAVYVNDLASTTVYECMDVANGQKAADKLGTKVETQTIGDVDNDTLYETYLVDNSALDLAKDYAYVKVYADFGTLGYSDPVQDTTVIGDEGKVDNDDIYTDISDIAYGASIVYVAAESKLTDGEAVHVWAVTSTNGVIKSIQKDEDTKAIISVTLSDDTVLPLSRLVGPYKTEFFVIGNVYNFVLDTHGDIIYATIDGARNLYAYTGDTRTVSGDWSKNDEYRFLNVTTGEELVANVKFIKGNGDDLREVKRGMYFDISASTMSDGRYVAELVTKGDNTYAAGYIVDDFNVLRTNTTSSYYLDPDSGLEKVYFSPETVTFIVVTGKGDNMNKQTFTGIQALMDNYDVATNGVISFKNAALTVSQSSTKDWNASVVFLFADSLKATSYYVFIPENINLFDDWTNISGDPGTYVAAYSKAYLEGEAKTIYLDIGQLRTVYRNGVIYRGFYALTYDAGTGRYWLSERIDNGVGDCYYDDVELHDTINGWTFESGRGTFAVDSNVVIVDLSNHKIGTTDLNKLYQYMKYSEHNQNPVSAAFTVNPYTNKVDYVYVVNSGWDAKITVALGDKLVKAGWDIIGYNDETVSARDVLQINDAEAEALYGKQFTLTIYNENLKNVTAESTKYQVTVAKGMDAITTSALNEGKLTISWTITADTAYGDKDVDFEVNGLNIGTIKVSEAADSGRKVTEGAETKEVILGTGIDVELKPAKDGKFSIDYTNECENNSHYTWEALLKGEHNSVGIDVVGDLSDDLHEITFTFYPWHNNCDYVVGSAEWVHE